MAKRKSAPGEPCKERVGKERYYYGHDNKREFGLDFMPMAAAACHLESGRRVAAGLPPDPLTYLVAARWARRRWVGAAVTDQVCAARNYGYSGDGKVLGIRIGPAEKTVDGVENRIDLFGWNELITLRKLVRHVWRGEEAPFEQG